jgi:putative flippase GtrA
VSPTVIRFLLVGVVNTAVGWFLMFFFYHAAGWSYWASTFIGNSVGAVVSYLLNRRFTFKSDTPLLAGFLRFILVVLVCYVLSYHLGERLTNWAFSRVDAVSGHAADIAILLGSALYTITNYFGQKLVVFAAAPANPARFFGRITESRESEARRGK